MCMCICNPLRYRIDVGEGPGGHNRAGGRGVDTSSKAENVVYELVISQNVNVVRCPRSTLRPVR